VDVPTARAPVLAARPTAPTVVALAVGALTVPLMLVYATWSGSDADLVLLSLACILVVSLVLWRFRRLLRVAAGQAEDLARLARTDALTGLPNRRTLDFELQRQEGISREQGSPMCVAMLDLDRFKPFNDEMGHQAGDEALVACARAWSSALGPSAFLARYGGEEFVAILPGHPLDQARTILESARRATPNGLTVSIGMAQRGRDENAVDTMLRADRALYRAKEGGRNRVVASEGTD
jgi:diguanylate cyclase (GGDEF)-like protein